ncbi:uncharacterized protein C9orf131 homolog [Acomys russatus]|uniref:uncharacterized protein C9orf131 homolog n=1 Tax=Acomys russatus TaxID=60746 RepID=UPI0021E305C5|nr:uncharacterized protein C9orf131 homolog [Acomys russatus]
MVLLHSLLTHALACRHCGSSICLQSPGNLVILFLFTVWQIRRWRQLGRRLQPWCSGDKMMQGKGLQLLYHLVAFLDCLWKQKSEEEEDGEEEEEESLDSQSLYSPCKDTLIENRFTAAPPQPSCSSEGLPKATETRAQARTQPSSPSRAYPISQILTNLPVRNTTALWSFLQQRKSQLFWGHPALHSESLETIFLSSDGPSPLKLSVCPSVSFNKVDFLSVYNLLLPYYHSLAYCPTPEAHTMGDLEGMTLGSQLAQPPPSLPIPPVSSHLKPLPVGSKEIESDTEAHTQRFTQNNEVPCASENQALYSQPELQKFRPSTFLYSSEAWREMPGDPSLHHHNPESPSASLLYPFYPQEALSRFEVLWATMEQNEHPEACERSVPTASPHPTSLKKCQRVKPIGDLSGLKALWETPVQKENPQIYELPILAPCQFTAPMTEPPGTPYETQWGITAQKDSVHDFDPLMSASCQSPGSLSEVKNVNPKGRLLALRDFWGNTGYRENSSVSMSPVSAPSLPLDTLSEHQEESPLEDLFGYEPRWQCRENSGNLWAFGTPTLDFNMRFYETSPQCVPQLKGRPSTENLCVCTDLVSSPSLPFASLPDSAVLLESKALLETKEQRKHPWVSDSPHPVHVSPLVPFTEPQRINTVDDFPRSEAIWKDTRNTRKCLSSEHPFMTLNPCPDHLQQSLRGSPLEKPFQSKAWCGDIQIKSNFLVSALPAQSCFQHLLGAGPSAVSSDCEIAGAHMQHNGHCSVSVSPGQESNPPPNLVLKSHVSEPPGDQCNCKPMESVVEQRKDYWATELPGPSFLSTPSQERHSNTEFLCRNVQEREASQGPNPSAVNPLQATSWPSTLAKALKPEPMLPGPQKAEMLSETRVEAPCPQHAADSEACDHPVSHAWRWSRELKLRLNKLQQSPPFKPPGSHHSSCSSRVLKPPTPESCLQQSHPLSLHPCHPPKVHRTEPLPVQASHCSPSSSQPQLQVSGGPEQESQKNKRMKWKVVVQTPSPAHVQMKANENCSGMEESSNTGVLVFSKRQDKTLVPFSAQKRVSPRKSKAEKCGRGTAKLASSTVTGKDHPGPACRSEGPIHPFPKKSQYKAQSSTHTAVAQQLLPNVAGPQDQQQKTKASVTQNPPQSKHCLWTPKKQLLSSTSKAPPTRGIQRWFAKFLGVADFFGRNLVKKV